MALLLVPLLFILCVLVLASNNGPLPTGWTAHEANGRQYFYNARTGESTWVRPAAVPTQPAGNLYQPQQQLPYPYNYQQQQPQYQGHNLNTQQPQQAVTVTPPSSTSAKATNTANATSDTAATPAPAVVASVASVAVAPNLVATDATDAYESETEPGRLVAELRKADQQIDELNDYIDKLLEKIKVGEDERAALVEVAAAANATAAALTAAAAAGGSGADVEVLDDLSEKIDVLQAELADKHDELEGLRAAKDGLERDLAAANLRLDESASALKTLRGNLTQQQNECKQNKKRCRDQERELEDCYREIGLLESDLKNVAGKSLRRLTRPSFFVRMFDGILATPWQVFGVGTGAGGGRAGGALKSTRSTRRAKGRLAAAQSTQAMNRTIAALRDNLTAMAKSLASKEAVVADLSQQLTDKEVEAEKRRDAYALLKDGVDELHGENERLAADVASRERDISSLTEQVTRSVDAAAALREQLQAAEDALQTAKEQYRAGADAYEARLAALAVAADANDGAAAELSAQVVNATETATRLRDEVDRLRATILAARPPLTQGGNASEGDSRRKKAAQHRPWFWFLLPWTW